MAELISIIVPVYNVEPFLPATLESLKQQDYPTYEVILVDDGSRDMSGEICDHFAESSDRFRVIHQENHGVSAARNTGLSHAKGTYITFVDADDRILPGYVTSLYREITDSHADMAVQMYESIYSGNERVRSVADDVDTVMDSLEYIEYQILESRDTSSCAKLYRRDLIEENGVRFAETIYNLEDMLFLFQYAKLCNRIRYTSTVNYHRIARYGGAVFSSFNTKKLTAFRAFDIVTEQLQQMGVPPVLVKKNKVNKFHHVILLWLDAVGTVRDQKLLKSMQEEARVLLLECCEATSIKDRIKYHGLVYIPWLTNAIYRLQCFIQQHLGRKPLSEST